MANQNTSVSSEDFGKLVASSISEGFMKLMNQQSESQIAAERSASMLQQHAAQGGSAGQPKTAFETEISDKVGVIHDNMSRINEEFAQMRQSLHLMEDSVDKKEETRSWDDMYGSIVKQLTANTSSMRTALDNSNPIYQSIRSFLSASDGAEGGESPLLQKASKLMNISEKDDGDGKNTVENDRKARVEEEDLLYKQEARPVMGKLSKALDKFMEMQETSAGVANGESTGLGLGSILSGLVAALGAGIGGFAFGYIKRFAGAWKDIGAELGQRFGKLGKDVKAWFKDTSVGKTLAKWKNSMSEAISAGIGKLGELKKAFNTKISEISASISKSIAGWKNAASESKVGKTAEALGKAVKKAGSGLAGLAKKMGGSLKSAVTKAGELTLKGAKAVGTAVTKTGPVSTAIKVAKKVGPMAAKIGAKVPQLQAVAGAVDTAVNVYKAAKAGASMKELRDMTIAGTVDAVADILMVPELMNATQGAIDAAVKGKGFKDIVKGAGAGFFKSRDPNEISIGNAAVAKAKNTLGMGDEASRRLAKAYNSGGGWKDAGYDVVSGSAAGFGHSAAVFRPKGDLADNMPDTGNRISESDRLEATKNMMVDAYKVAFLSQEVQEANAKNAKETGSAINGTLFGS